MGLASRLGTCLALLLVGQLSLLRAHREHKVHNIVLYPDKESWCKTTPIKQVVTWASCLPQELDNNVCVGACFSYMVPHSEPSAPGDLIRPYCDSCQPLDSIWHTVSLQCRDKDGNPTSMQKKVQIITNCSCSSCMESERIKPDLNSLLQSLELESTRRLESPTASSDSQAPVQFAPPAVAQTAAPAAPDESALAGATAEAPQLQSQSPLLLLEQTEEAPVVVESNQQQQQQQPQHEVPDLLLDPNLNATAKLDASLDGKPNDRLLHFFKQLNDPSWAVDKLDHLGSLDKLDKLDKLASEEAGAKELLSKLSELLHKYRQTQTAESVAGEAMAGASQGKVRESEEGDEDEEGADGLDNQGQEKAEVLQPTASSSTAPGLLPPELPKDEDDEEVPSLQDQQLRVAASLLQRTGPHHSLVLDASVKEKIDVDSHYLHPALAGQEISYHDNLLLDKAKKKDF